MPVLVSSLWLQQRPAARLLGIEDDSPQTMVDAVAVPTTSSDWVQQRSVEENVDFLWDWLMDELERVGWAEPLRQRTMELEVGSGSDGASPTLQERISQRTGEQVDVSLVRTDERGSSPVYDGSGRIFYFLRELGRAADTRNLGCTCTRMTRRL